jgi:hypothetical protein
MEIETGVDMKILIKWLLPMLLTLTLIGCGNEVTPEDQIRERIRQGELAAEEGRGMEVAGIVSDDYLDDHSRDPKEIRRMIIGYIMRHKQIHLLARVQNVAMASETEGTATVLMGMLGQQGNDQLPLPQIRADLYRFQLTFRNEGDEWNLIDAKWRRAAPDDFLEGGFTG